MSRRVYITQFRLNVIEIKINFAPVRSVKQKKKMFKSTAFAGRLVQHTLIK